MSAKTTGLQQSRMKMMAWAKWSVFVATLVLLGAWAGSAAFRVALVGWPFNRSWQVAGGCVVMEWFVPGADGAVNGFGNPGWRVEPRKATTLRFMPWYMKPAAATYRQLFLPLWPLVGGAAFLWWRLRRVHARLVLAAAMAKSECPECGYPREGLRSDGRCPECGWKALKLLLARVSRRSGRMPTTPVALASS